MAARVSVPLPDVPPLGILTALAFFAVAMITALVVRFKASYSVAALIVTGPFDFAHAAGPTTVTLPKVVLVGAIIGLALRRASLAPLRSPRIRALLGGAIALVAVNALTAIPAVYVDAVARETLKAAQYLAVFVVATVAFTSDDDAPLIWNAIAVTALLVCLSAVAQEFSVAPSGLWIHGRIVPRIAGPLEGPNQLAGWLDLMAPMLTARALLGSRSVVFAILATLAVTTDVLTLSRSGSIGIVVGLVTVAIFAFRAGNKRRVVIGAGLAVVPIIALFLATLFPQHAAFFDANSIAERYMSAAEQDVDNGLATRPYLWRAALTMWRSDPALGVGAGNFELLTPKAGLVGVRTHANSVYLQALAEGGLLLFAAVVWTLVAGVSTALRTGRTALLVGVAAATLGLAAHEVFDDLTFFPKVGVLLWTLLGIAAASAAIKE